MHGWFVDSLSLLIQQKHSYYDNNLLRMHFTTQESFQPKRKVVHFFVAREIVHVNDDYLQRLSSGQFIFRVCGQYGVESKQAEAKLFTNSGCGALAGLYNQE